MTNNYKIWSGFGTALLAGIVAWIALIAPALYYIVWFSFYKLELPWPTA